MKDIQQEPVTPAEESTGLNWMWRWAHMKVILPLCLFGSIASVLLSDAVNGKHLSSVMIMMGVCFALYIVMWVVVLLPAIMLRLFCKRRLSKGISFILAFSGLFLYVSLLTALQLKTQGGSIMLVLFVASAYKVARSHFSWQSIGLPVLSNRIVQNRCPVMKEEQTADAVISQKVQPLQECHHVESCGAPRFTCLGVFFVVLYAAGLTSLLDGMFMRHAYYIHRDYALFTSACIPLVAVLWPAITRDIILQSLSKANKFYKRENPVKAIAYAVIALGIAGIWFAVLWTVALVAEEAWSSDIYADGCMQIGGYVLLLVLMIISQLVIPRLLRIGFRQPRATQWKLLFVFLFLSACISCGIWSIFAVGKYQYYVSCLESYNQEKIQLQQSLNQAAEQTKQAGQKWEQLVKARKEERKKILQLRKTRQSQKQKEAIRKEFSRSVAYDDALKVQNCVQLGVDVNVPILYEIENRNFELLPLHLALYMGNLKTVRILLNSGADIAKGNENCSNALEALALCTRDSVVYGLFNLLLENGMNPNLSYIQPIAGNKSAIFKVAKSVADQFSDIPDARQVAYKKASELTKDYARSSPDVVELTALHFAAFSGWEDIVQQLLDKGAEQKDSAMGTPLYVACQVGHPVVAEVLLQSGADINYTSHTAGWTPLIRSIRSQRDDIAMMLIDRGADVNILTKHGKNALWMATIMGNEKVLKRLLEAGASLEYTKDSPLRVALIRKDFNCARLLIEYGIRKDVEDVNGITDAMFICAKFKNSEQWCKLLSADEYKQATFALNALVKRKKASN